MSIVTIGQTARLRATPQTSAGAPAASQGSLSEQDKAEIKSWKRRGNMVMPFVIRLKASPAGEHLFRTETKLARGLGKVGVFAGGLAGWVGAIVAGEVIAGALFGPSGVVLGALAGLVEEIIAGNGITTGAAAGASLGSNLGYGLSRLFETAPNSSPKPAPQP